MNYGIPYKGSKNKVIKWLMPLLPSGEVFVDLFCGGCAVTHAAMLSGRYKRYVINDVDPMMPKTFIKAIQGGYRDEDRWISREDFFRLKANDEYAAICFSFGNNLRNYLYSPAIEPYKKACHYAILFDEWELLRWLCPDVADAAYKALEHFHDGHERRLRFGPAIVRRLKEIGDVELIDRNPLYNSCHVKRPNKSRPVELESLERLQSLERLERLEMSYDKVSIPDNSTVYCDIPYKGTDKYGKNKSEFDHDRFFEWCRNMPFPVYISEYTAPDDFIPIWGKKVFSTFSATSNSCRRTEYVFVYKKWIGLYYKLTNRLF